MLLGCIGDDFTGSSDLGNTLSRAGMTAVQYLGVPDRPAEPDVEAGIVALKSRSLPAAEAVAQSLAALDWLRAQGCRQFLFKYCSTFDSTPEGNIGPVAEALAEALGARTVIVCPAFPRTGRTVYQGHLFVQDQLLNESGMERHPLTPMTDPDLRRWLALQATGPVGHVTLAAVRAGPDAVTKALAREDAAGRRLIVADATSDADLLVLGRAAEGLPLITGGSGIALGLPANFAARGELSGRSSVWQGEPGPAAILAGSCSEATRRQVARHAERHPVRHLSVEEVMSGEVTADALAAWTLAQEGVPLVASSADPATVAAAQARYGREALAGAIEGLFAQLAHDLVARGVTRLISAGGETSGAVVAGLETRHLEIGPEIAPGVPAMRAGPSLVVALKSGNFGGPDFFAEAAAVLERDA